MLGLLISFTFILVVISIAAAAQWYWETCDARQRELDYNRKLKDYQNRCYRE